MERLSVCFGGENSLLDCEDATAPVRTTRHGVNDHTRSLDDLEAGINNTTSTPVTMTSQGDEHISIQIPSSSYQPLGTIQYELQRRQRSTSQMGTNQSNNIPPTLPTPSPTAPLRCERFSTASSNTMKTRRFTCRFDPADKNARLLVLRFDLHGNPSFQEMTRADILHLTQEAAKTPPIEPSEEDEVPKRPRQIKRRESAGIKSERSTVVDVQRVHARDIRRLDNAFAVSNEPAIVVRKQAILMNADPIRAVIMRDQCLVFVPDGADSLLSMLKENFRDSVAADQEAAYEFKALEALLATLCKNFETDYENIAPLVIGALDKLAGGLIMTAELETLRVFKNSMHEFESQVDGVRRCLMEFLDNEEDLRLLYMTKLCEDPSLLNDLFSFDSEEAEVLIENYMQEIYSTHTKAHLMLHRIQNTESLVMLKLDSARNYLLGVDLVFSLVAIGMSIGTYATGAFGMNLNSGLQEAPYWFWSVVCSTIAAAIAIVITGVLFFRSKGIFVQ